MKDFYTHLKDQLHGKKDQNYQLVREIQQLNRDRLTLSQQIVFSQRRIQELEKLVGIQRQGRDAPGSK